MSKNRAKILFSLFMLLALGMAPPKEPPEPMEDANPGESPEVGGCSMTRRRPTPYP